MQKKYRLYRRANGNYYAEDCETGARESLGAKDKTGAENLLQAKNEAFAQPAFNREMAKVYLRAQDPDCLNMIFQDGILSSEVQKRCFDSLNRGGI